MDLRYVLEETAERKAPGTANEPIPKCSVAWKELDLRPKGHKGLSVQSTITLNEGNVVTFVLRDLPKHDEDDEDALAKDAKMLKAAKEKQSSREGEYGAVVAWGVAALFAGLLGAAGGFAGVMTEKARWAAVALLILPLLLQTKIWAMRLFKTLEHRAMIRFNPEGLHLFASLSSPLGIV